MPRPTIGNLNIRPLRRTYLREWRKFREFSLEAACEKIGVTHGLLSKIERSLKPYNQQFLESAADVYECQPSDLLDVNPLVSSNINSLLALRRARTEEAQRAIVEDIVRKVFDTRG